MDAGAILACDVPMAFALGPDAVLTGNAQFRTLFRDGCPARDVFPDGWEQGDRVVALPGDRHVAIHASPAGNATFVIITDLTAQVRAERGLSTLRALAACTGADADEVLRAIASVLAADPDDFGGALLYASDATGARFVAGADLDDATVRLADLDLAGRLVLPFEGGFLVVRPSPHRPLDRRYRALFQLAADTIGTALHRANSHAALDALVHDLRNPLAPIKAALHLMERGSHERERKIIAGQVDHLMHVVDDLLDAAHIARGKVTLARKPVELADVVAEALALTTAQFEERRHVVRLELPPGHVVDGDYGRLVQIARVLLSNAARFTPGRGCVEITLSRDDDRHLLAVRDTRGGLSPEAGLAIVRGLVGLHAGTVSATSTQTGAEVIVGLPRVDAQATRPRGTLPPAAQALQVLVVDDNIDTAELLATSIREMGHTATVAFDGAEGLRLANELQPQVALLDLNLPMMDGYELARQISERGTKPALLVAISGYGNATDRTRSREAGFDVHFVKPIHVDALRLVLERLTG